MIRYPVVAFLALAMLIGYVLYGKRCCTTCATPDYKHLN